MSEYELTPKVDQVQEFIEIATDFGNRLDLVREAISNSFDANATKIWVDFSVIQDHGEKVLKIVLTDNGDGMDEDGLQSFFDLGNSLRRNDPNKIGEKGHGTKIYFNSQKVTIETVNGGFRRIADMDEPMRKLQDRQIPKVNVSASPEVGDHGTKITILGYNNNRRDKFTHHNIRDYIKWFTRAGSIQWVFNSNAENSTEIYLRGLGYEHDGFEKFEARHDFGKVTENMEQLLEWHGYYAPDYYCRRSVWKGHLKNHPEIRYQAVFSIEGSRVKYSYNPMLRRRGFQHPDIDNGYKIQDRYGLWLCKDFIPIQRKNEWLPTQKTEWTRLHAFINCQEFCLTANRGSIENTPTEILEDLHNVVKSIYNQIEESDDWHHLEWLERDASANRTINKEKSDFDWRKKRLNQANIASYEDFILIEPQRESGVFALFLQLSMLAPDLFPFQVLDYDTHQGIDVIVKGDNTTPIMNAKLFYVEFKHQLERSFNHSFENLHSVVCWDTQVKQDHTVESLDGAEIRTMRIVQPESDNDYTRYFLEDSRNPHRIEVFVLKDYLKQKLGLEFRPRTDASAI